MPDDKDYKHDGFTEEEIEFMRMDLESDMEYSKLIDHVQKSMEEKGLDFWVEYEKWQQDKEV
jgi:uncharacterized protein (DUF302 family)